MDINIESQIVVQTSAQWAADNTVYSAKRILVTSDEYYGSTDQRKFKIADGVQTWAQLDYMPIAQTLAQVLANGSSTNAISFKSPDSQTELLIANNNIDSYVDDGNTSSEINITPTTISISTTGTSATLNAPTIYIDAPTINLTQGTASRIVETDASKNLTYAAKGTAYNKNFGTGSGDVTQGNDVRLNNYIQLACSDETTALTTGTAKITFRMPYGFTLTGVRASLTTAQTSGNIFTVDINEGGVSILSTKLTIDNTEKTSVTAATPVVISDTSLADDAEITIDIDQIGDGTAKGLKVTLIGYNV